MPNHHHIFYCVYRRKASNLDRKHATTSINGHRIDVDNHCFHWRGILQTSDFRNIDDTNYASRHAPLDYHPLYHRIHHFLHQHHNHFHRARLDPNRLPRRHLRRRRRQRRGQRYWWWDSKHRRWCNNHCRLLHGVLQHPRLYWLGILRFRL